jgi:hypothetical protein
LIVVVQINNDLVSLDGVVVVHPSLVPRKNELREVGESEGIG